MRGKRRWKREKIENELRSLKSEVISKNALVNVTASSKQKFSLRARACPFILSANILMNGRGISPMHCQSILTEVLEDGTREISSMMGRVRSIEILPPSYFRYLRNI